MSDDATLEAELEALLQREWFDPPEDFVAGALVKDLSVHEAAERDPVGWWEEQARALDWFEPWEHALEDFVEKLLKQNVRLTKVHRLMRRNGVEVPYSTLHRYAVEALDFGRKAATVPVIDGKPGEELQLDVGWVAVVMERPGRA